jgi:ABC-type sugar transport system substrate-binding protein
VTLPSMNGNCKPVQNQGKGLWPSLFSFSISALFAGLLLVLIPGSSVSAQSTKKHKIGALTKSLANPYFLLMKQGYEYAQKNLGVEVVFGSTPTEEARSLQCRPRPRW